MTMINKLYSTVCQFGSTLMRQEVSHKLAHDGFSYIALAKNERWKCLSSDDSCAEGAAARGPAAEGGQQAEDQRVGRHHGHEGGALSDVDCSNHISIVITGVCTASWTRWLSSDWLQLTSPKSFQRKILMYPFVADTMFSQQEVL